MRAIFDEADAAEAASARLRASGFRAELARDHFAGEDDDEDHPWAVLSDAPAGIFQQVCEEHDGWWEGETSPPPTAPPAAAPLPSSPRRIKRLPR